MNGGIVLATKPARKIFSAIAPVSCSSSVAPALMPTIAMKVTRPRSSRMLRAAFGVLPKKRRRDTSDDTRMPDSSRPPALPRPTEKSPTGTVILPISRPSTMPADSVSRSVDVLGRAILPSFARDLVDRALEAGHVHHVEALAARCRCRAGSARRARSMRVICSCPAKSSLRERLQHLAVGFLFGHQDFGLVERDVERLRVRRLPGRSGRGSRSGPRGGRPARSRRPAAARRPGPRRASRRRARR